MKTLPLVFLIPALPALAVLNNATQGGKAVVQSSTLGSGYDAGKAVNNSTVGNQTDITHTAIPDPEPFWRVDLGATMRVREVVLFNRTDCCGGRLRDIHVDVLAADTNTVVWTSGVQNPGNSLGGGTGDYQAGPPSPLTLDAGGAAGRFVRVRRIPEGTDSHDRNTLSLAEVQVRVDNAAQGRPATQTSDYGGGVFPASLAVNGNLGDFTHTLNSDTNAAWTVDLGATRSLDSILLHNRDSCCQARLRDILVDLLDGTNVVWTSPGLNRSNALVNPPWIAVDLHALAGGPRNADGVRVRRIASGANADDLSVLSLGEVQVFTLPEVQIAPVTYAAGQATLTWTSVPGAVYAIQWSTNHADWQDLATGIVAAGTTVTEAVADGFAEPFVLLRVVQTSP